MRSICRFFAGLMVLALLTSADARAQSVQQPGSATLRAERSTEALRAQLERAVVRDQDLDREVALSRVDEAVQLGVC